MAHATTGQQNQEILYENITSSIDPRLTVEVLEEIPDGVIPKAFESWEKAVEWINSLNLEPPKTRAVQLNFFPNENYVPRGEIGNIGYTPMPSGSGTITHTQTYDLPGLSAQTVRADHYFEYKNGTVTDWSVYVNISGLGFSTYQNTYKKLEVHDLGKWKRYFGVCAGNLGVFVSIGGVPVGVYQVLELTHVLYRAK